MIKSTTDIPSEMNIMEAELRENEIICLENGCRLESRVRVNEASKCSKMKIFKVLFAKTAPT